MSELLREEEAVRQQAPGPERYPPIEDYGIIGDCRSAALVSRDGSIDWLCWPRFDSPPLFARLLDWDRGGFFSVRPAGRYSASRRYRPDSNVLVTTFRTQHGSAEVTDLLAAVPSGKQVRHRLPDELLIRRVRGLSGDLRMEMRYQPVTDFGRLPPATRREGRHSVVSDVPRGYLLQLAADVPLDVERHSAGASFALKAGEETVFALAFTARSPAVFPPMERLKEVIDATDGYWRAWASRCRYEGAYRQAVVRSALALKLLAYAPSGAIVAAPTSSLPERIGAGHNWDYRYCWLRDASLTVRGLQGLGYAAEARAFVEWLLHATRLTHPELEPVYTVHGETSLRERELDYLDGYRGSRPVRSGNAAARQVQLDVYGEVLNAVAFYLSSRQERLDRDQRKFVEGIARYVLKHWRDPDSGIWETRRGKALHTHSKVLCWVALDRAARLAERGVLHLHPGDLHREAANIAEAVHERGFNPQVNAYTNTFGGSELDASVLQFPLLGFAGGADPRMATTIEAVRLRLGRDELVFRHRREETAGEGAFAVCSFWLADALARQGRLEEAHAVFRRMIDRANDLGLYPEEYDAETGSFLGNFPLAFTHIAMINAALTLSEVRE